MTIDRDIQLLATTQRGLVTRGQLVGLGLSPKAIKRRLATSVLVRVHESVYRVVAVPSHWEQRLLAACLAAGKNAAVSHHSAARLWSLRRATAKRVEISIPATDLPRLSGALVHRSTLLEPIDIRTVDGLSVTRPERTLVDVASMAPERTIASMLEDAILKGLTTIDRVWLYLTRYGRQGRQGVAAIKRVLSERGPSWRPTESGLEDDFCAVLKRFSVPLPEPQVRIGRVRVDRAYPDVRLAIEIDSRLWHSSAEDFRRDREKRRELLMLGWRVLPVTEFDVYERPGQVAADVLQALTVLRSQFLVA